MNYRGNILGFAAGNPISRHDFGESYPEARRLAVDLHLHHHLEMIFILEGEYRFGTDGFEGVFRPGDIFVINSMEPHWGYCEFRPNTRNSYAYLMLEPEQLPRGLHEELDRLIESGVSLENRIPAGESGVFELGTRLIDACNTGSNLESMGLALQLLGRLNGFCKSAAAASKPSAFAAAALDFLEKHYAEDLTLEQVSREIGYEKTYFCRKFQQEFHYTFTQYLHRFRMKKFLSHPELDLQSIARCAHAVGYLNYSTFHKVFRKLYGLSPKEYLLQYK